ncbi:MFS transporter [Candidatus Bathyarchaeota archaeon]|nr:MFS transporter [Candidatus Bathyarchaeota archaeon]
METILIDAQWNNADLSQKTEEKRLVLPSLGFSTFVQQLPGILSGLLLIEIADTFKKSIGLMGQMRTTAALIGILVALAMGYLSVRYSYKRLLVVGLSVIILASIGCSISPSYDSMLFFYALLGVGGTMCGPMISSLIGQHLPFERRAGAVGVINGSAAFAYLVGSPSIAFISDQYGWRATFQIFIVPLMALSLLFVIMAIPRDAKKETIRISDALNGYRTVLGNRAALACLAAAVFSSGIWSSHLTFSASYIREVFLLPKFITSLSSIIGATCFILGSLSAGKLVARFSRKRVAAYFSIPSGLLILLYLNMPTLLSALLTGYLASLCNGILLASSGALNLEQVPEYRGTMMSLGAAAGSLGSAIAIGVVGWLIMWDGYGVAGFYMLSAGLVASVVYLKLVPDQ